MDRSHSVSFHQPRSLSFSPLLKHKIPHFSRLSFPFPASFIPLVEMQRLFLRETMSVAIIYPKCRGKISFLPDFPMSTPLLTPKPFSLFPHPCIDAKLKDIHSEFIGFWGNLHSIEIFVLGKHFFSKFLGHETRFF